MNLFCPHCQQMLTVPEQNAGQVMKCPLCNNTFTVPALPPMPASSTTTPSGSTPGPVLGDLAVDIPLSPLPPSPEPPPLPVSTGQPAHDEPVYRVASEPAKPTLPWPGSSEPAPKPTPREKPAASPPANPFPPAPAPPAGYSSTYTIWISPHVVPWLAPVSLLLVFVLLFVPWIAFLGVAKVETANGSATKVAAITFNAWQMSFGEGSSLILTFYVLLFLLALIASMGLHVLRVQATGFRPPPWLNIVWPWRTAITMGLICVSFLLLVIHCLTGFAATNSAEANALLHYTFWFDLAVLLHLIAVVGVLLEFWLERRGSGQPVPRIDIHW